MNDTENSASSGSLTLAVVQAMAISPEKAMQIADQYKAAARKTNTAADDSTIESIVSKKVISKYARHTALSGGAFALPGVIPGIGTAVAAVGGGVGDAAVCLKSQVDMTMILAANYGWDLTELDARHMAMMIAVSGSLEKLGTNTAIPLASKAGVRMLRQYLKGASLTVVKQMFKSFGVSFSRSALERSLPFGIGVGLGSGLNYTLTKYVGAEAVKCFTIDRQMRQDGDLAVA